MARLNETQIATAKSWLHDIFVLAREISPCKDSSYGCMYGARYGTEPRKTNALAIVDELKMRNFTDLNSAFEFFANEGFSINMSDWRDLTRKKADMLAKYVAWFCYTNKIYWNDTIRDPEEIKIFKETLLGQALAEYDCFATTPDRKATTGLGGSSRSPRAPKAASTGDSGSIPATGGFKGLGPMSSKARDLKGMPGEKVKLTGRLYTIEGNSATTKSIPAAFIKPLDGSGAAGATNKVFFGTSWKGYKNCVCFYTSDSEALAVATKLKDDSKIPASTSKVTINYRYADANGYFKVGTEYGDCYILARELNEDLVEEVETPRELTEAEKYMAIPLEEEVYEMTNNITNPDEYFTTYRKAQD